MEEDTNDRINAAIERVRTLAWKDPEGRMMIFTAGPAGMTVTLFDEPTLSERSATLRPVDVRQLGKFMFECAAEFGEEWRGSESP